MIQNPDTQNEAASLIKRLCWRNPLAWLEKWTKILIDNVAQHFHANVLQRRLVDVVLTCLFHRLPIRIVVLKPRQRGISTISMGVLAWLMFIYSIRAAIVGGIKWQAENLFTIFKTYHEHDTMPWGVAVRVTDEEIVYANNSRLEKFTALGAAPGRSGTFQALVCTEAAFWGKDGAVKNAGAVLAGFLACVKQVFPSLVIIESTSAGPSGMFYRRWQEGVDYEVWKKDPKAYLGKYVRVFAGVFEFKEICDPVEGPEEENAIFDGVGARNLAEKEREKQLRRRWNLKAGQIKAWRRLLDESDNDPIERDLNYPPEPKDAWQAGSLCRFNSEGLRLMRERAERAQPDLRWFVLERQRDDAPLLARFLVTNAADAQYVMSEPPIPGCRYICIVDNMKGRATDEKKRDVDCNAVTIIRDGYVNSKSGAWMPPKVAAAVKHPNRMEPFEGADLAADLAEFYGRCPIVVEANGDPGWIPHLRQKKGVDLWQEKVEASDVENAGQNTGRYGFWMSDTSDQKGVRSQIISELARAVVDVARAPEGHLAPFYGGIDVPFLWIIDEMEVFVRDPDTGFCAAQSGKHDDWVMNLCMGMATKAGGKVYVPPVVHSRPTPWMPYEGDRQSGMRERGVGV